jgi:hypothetical protein
MTTSKMLIALAIIAAMSTASAQSFHPSVAGRETTTRPWSAPVGHRQPHASDIPAATPEAHDAIDPEDAFIDRKISGICRGC